MLQKSATDSKKNSEVWLKAGINNPSRFYIHICNCLNTIYSLSTEPRITHRRMNHAPFYVKDLEKKKQKSHYETLIFGKELFLKKTSVSL